MSTAHPNRGGSGGRSAPGVMKLVAALVAGWTLALANIALAQTPADEPRLSLALVVRADSPPLLDANGVSVSGRDNVLSDTESGLRTLARTKAPFAVSASPLWVDELLAAERTRIYAPLLALATRRPLLSGPYTYATLTDEKPDDVRRELERGESALRQTLQSASQRILDPPGLALSRTVLSAARGVGLRAALADADVVGSGPTVVNGVTLIPSVDLGAARDADGLIERFGPSARLAVLGPPGRSLSGVVASLAADKRIRLVNIGDLVARPVQHPVDLEAPPAPPEAYRRAISRADAAVREFASYTLPGNPTAKRLSTLLARAMSTVNWRRNWPEGIARSNVVAELAGAERALVAATDGSVTLTSRRGAVPVTLENRSRYPVRLRVRVSSPKLAFPAGNSKVVTVSPRGLTITFIAEARSSGSFPMDVSVSSPDGAVQFGDGHVMVRSTAANVVALILTLSGLLFLVAWSSRDLLRKAMRGRSR